jgi:pimeloyl-ACP methyl ester carboxylesterase
MRLAFWPGLGGGPASLAEIGPVLASAGVEAVTIDPRYGARTDYSLPALAAELAATGADVYAGHSWGAAVAATAAAARPPCALVLLDGGHVSPHEFVDFGAERTLDERVAELRAEHEGYRWPSMDAYRSFVRERSPRWNERIEEMALEGMRTDRSGDVVPPFDADELERIFRCYEAYDAGRTLDELPDHLRVLLVVANAEDEHAGAQDRFMRRFTERVPLGDVRRVDSGHDVILGLGSELGQLVSGWLRAE